MSERNEQELWTVFDLAEWLRVTPQTVRRMRKRGELPRPLIRLRPMRWMAVDVRRWVTEKLGEAPAEQAGPPG